MDNFNLKVKQEVNYHSENRRVSAPCTPFSVIDLSSSDSDADDSSSSSSSSSAKVTGKRSRVCNGGKVHSKKKKKKKKKLNGVIGVILPVGFLDPLPSNETTLHSNGNARRSNVVEGENAGRSEVSEVQTCKQFWKAADFDGATTANNWETPSGGMDHVRIHPRFLHSNATSHKWVLGAFAELLDNALDEVCNGASYVNIDMITNKKDKNRMLLIEDNGGGMDPDKMRQCMSLGYSLKSKVANTIGQYGNGFKTSTMRLGADVIVFSRCAGKDGKRSTQSIGLLSYTFLRNTGKEDIVVPMLDYERGGKEWKKMIRSSTGDWNINVKAVVRWSPFSCEADLLRQFDHMKDQGTRIIIYNLWEDDQGQLELDFDADRHDIQIRGVNRDEKSIQMAHQFPNSRHFLTYCHSLRSYASILYLRIPLGFRMILRGKDVEHHNIVNDMMMTKEVTYRPQPGAEGVPKESNMVAVVTMGFVKDAKAHIDVQGFNVYHKNRLIKPFWRLWNAAGSDGRGVIGVLEANFVEPAHDKQGFERTIVLSRLETKLVQMQKIYWSSYCHKIGYAPRRNKNNLDDKEFSPEYSPEPPSKSKKGSAVSSGKTPPSVSNKYPHKSQNRGGREYGESPSTAVNGNGYLHKGVNGRKTPTKSGRRPIHEEPSSISAENVSDDNLQTVISQRNANVSANKTVYVNKSLIQDGSRSIQVSYVEHSQVDQDCAVGGRINTHTRSQSKGSDVGRNESAPSNGSSPSVEQLLKENLELKERLKRREEDILGDLLHDLESERERCKSLAAQLLDSNQRNEDLNKEQISLIEIFSEERERRDKEEENLRKKLKDASNTIQELLDKVRLLQKMKPGYKSDR